MYQMDVGAADRLLTHPFSGISLARYGAPEGNRTPNLLIRSQMLYPLSYGRRCSVVTPAGCRLPAEAPGFEPGRGGTPTALAVRRHRPD
jgi:hypothetical protein